ncbi:MAG TPA: hypothetical protein VFV71_12990 [Burkholderiales bacterium]|nr:hypothetical protein [Burkholderiales bacterium]
MAKAKSPREAPLPNPDEVLARMLAMPPEPKKAAPKTAAKKPRK